MTPFDQRGALAHALDASKPNITKALRVIQAIL